jgi:hypothetical protein
MGANTGSESRDTAADTSNNVNDVPERPVE